MGVNESKFSVEKHNNSYITGEGIDLLKEIKPIFPDRLGKNTPGYTFDMIFRTGSDPPSRSDYTQNIDLVELLFYDYFRTYPSKGVEMKQPIGIPMRLEGMITEVQFVRANNEKYILDPSTSEFKALQIWSTIAYLNITIGGSVVGIPLNDVSNCLYVLYRGASDGFKGAMSVSLASSAPVIVDLPNNDITSAKPKRIVEQLAPLPNLPIAKVKISFFVIPFSESKVGAYLADAPTYQTKSILVSDISVKDATQNNLEVEASNLSLIKEGVIGSVFSEFMLNGMVLEEVSIAVEKANIKFNYSSSLSSKEILAGCKLSILSSSSYGKVCLPLLNNDGPLPSRIVWQSDILNWQKTQGHDKIFFWIDMRKELWEEVVEDDNPKIDVFLQVKSKMK